MAIPVLVEALESHDDYTRQVAASSLGQMGPAAKAAIPKLRSAGYDEKFLVRLQAALAVWWLTAETEPMQAALTTAFHDKFAEGDHNTWYERGETLSAVREMGPASATMLPTMLAAMKHSPDHLMLHFILTLASLGEAGRDALPTLAEISKNTDWEIRKAATDAIKQISHQREGRRK